MYNLYLITFILCKSKESFVWNSTFFKSTFGIDFAIDIILGIFVVDITYDLVSLPWHSLDELELTEVLWNHPKHLEHKGVGRINFIARHKP
jgi:hypothetical protein